MIQKVRNKSSHIQLFQMVEKDVAACLQMEREDMGQHLELMKEMIRMQIKVLWSVACYHLVLDIILVIYNARICLIQDVNIGEENTRHFWPPS